MGCFVKDGQTENASSLHRLFTFNATHPFLLANNVCSRTKMRGPNDHPSILFIAGVADYVDDFPLMQGKDSIRHKRKHSE